MNSKLIEKLADPEYRKSFVASQISIGIPFQIRALQKARGWTQEELAEKAGMLQPRISAMCKPGRTKFTIETLRRLAAAFDCGIVVRFAPFSELVRWSNDFEPDTFDVPTYEADTGLIEHKPAASQQISTSPEPLPVRVVGSDRIAYYGKPQLVGARGLPKSSRSVSPLPFIVPSVRTQETQNV